MDLLFLFIIWFTKIIYLFV